MTERASRLVAIDWLRGLVMVLMALDHVRDYFGDFTADPVDLSTTTPAWFLTRWVTHFCAPVFVLLAGTGAFLYGARGRSTGQLSLFLLTRGLWLIVLEFTVVYFGWTNTFTLGLWFLQVIAAIGFAMVVLSGLVFLPRRVVLLLGLVIVCGHNLRDGGDGAPGGWLMALLFEGTLGRPPLVLSPEHGVRLMVVYPLVPWVGVMLLGYALGPVFLRERGARRRALLLLGAAVTAGFVLLRATNFYGDPGPWQSYAETEAGPRGALWTVMSFVNCQKYPPSLLYLAMTLGPSLLLLAAVDREPGWLGRRLVVFGRVPLFYYVLHIYLVHLASRLYYLAVHGRFFSIFDDGLRGLYQGKAMPDWYGGSVLLVYSAWVVVVALLYPACAWYEALRRRVKSPLLSYL